MLPGDTTRSSGDAGNHWWTSWWGDQGEGREEGMTTCNACGAPLGADWLYCNRCGTQVQAESPVDHARRQARSQRGVDGRRVLLDDVVYAVVDVETTGFSAKSDRICEVAVLCTDAHGEVVDEYVSLVNPGRSLGMTTRIHGITSTMVSTAPPFRDVADDLLARMAGRVLVAHNAAFDLGFLESEFARVGVFLPHQSLVCTKKLGRALLDCRGSLASLCAALMVPHESAHSAGGDARACASVFQCLLGRARNQGFRTIADLGADYGPAHAHAWPRLAFEETVWPREEEPDGAFGPEPDTASDLTMEDLLGASLVLTGDFRAGDRKDVEAYLSSLGIAVRGSVSKKTYLLVTSDVQSMSSKATKARDLGVRIIHEDVLWRILGGAPSLKTGGRA